MNLEKMSLKTKRKVMRFTSIACVVMSALFSVSSAHGQNSLIASHEPTDWLMIEQWSRCPSAGNGLKHQFNNHYCGGSIAERNDTIYIPRMKPDDVLEDGLVVYAIDAATGEQLDELTVTFSTPTQKKFAKRRFEYIAKDDNGTLVLMSAYSSGVLGNTNNYTLYLNESEQRVVIAAPIMNINWETRKIAIGVPRTGTLPPVDKIDVLATHCFQDLQISGDVLNNKFEITGVSYPRTGSANVAEPSSLRMYRWTFDGSSTAKYDLVGEIPEGSRTHNAHLRALDGNRYIINGADNLTNGKVQPRILENTGTFTLSPYSIFDDPTEEVEKTGDAVEIAKVAYYGFAVYTHQASPTKTEFAVAGLSSDGSDYCELLRFPKESWPGVRSWASETHTSILISESKESRAVKGNRAMGQPPYVVVYVYSPGSLVTTGSTATEASLARYHLMPSPTSGIEDVLPSQDNDSIRREGNLLISDSENAISVYTLTGIEVCHGIGTVGLSQLTHGCYIVRCGHIAERIAL